MTTRKEDLENNPEFMALMDNETIDTAKIKEQVGLGKPADVDSGGESPGEKKPAAESKAGESGSEEQQKPAGESNNNQINAHEAFLKEIFGDRFKTIEEVKGAKITEKLDEVEVLRREKTELETKLGSKPKSNFANDEVALYNEFVKETGLRSYGLFEKINKLDVATMDPMEALVTKHIIDNPKLIGKEEYVKAYFEKKYNVDPNQVEEQELEINKIGMESDGNLAIKSLQAIKEKLKVPEPAEEPQKPRELSSEEKAALQTGWNKAGQEITASLAKLKIPIKNSKDPLLEYEISESEQKEIMDFVSKYAVENHMELNETNKYMVGTMVYNQLMINKLPEIAHSIFEKARSMTEQQVHAMYENPSPAKNTDRPDTGAKKATDLEEQQEAIFKAEMGRY